MQYMLLIYTNKAAVKSATDADRDAMFRAYREYTPGHHQERKHEKAGDALQPTTTATTVRVRDGEALTSDGPFARRGSSSAATTWSRRRISARRPSWRPASRARRWAASTCGR